MLGPSASARASAKASSCSFVVGDHAVHETELRRARAGTRSVVSISSRARDGPTVRDSSQAMP